MQRFEITPKEEKLRKMTRAEYYLAMSHCRLTRRMLEQWWKDMDMDRKFSDFMTDLLIYGIAELHV